MQHERTYQHFQSFVQKHAKSEGVFLQLYLMIKLYINGINKLGGIYQMLQISDTASNPSKSSGGKKRIAKKIKLEMELVPKFKQNKE